MVNYKKKLIAEIEKLNDEQTLKLYNIYQILKKDFDQMSKEKWLEGLKKISEWKDDDFDEIDKGFKNWKSPQKII